MRAKLRTLSLLLLISIITLGCGVEPTERIVPPEPTPWATLSTQTPAPTASPTPTVRPEPTPTFSPQPSATPTPPALGLNEGKIVFAGDPNGDYKTEIYVIDASGVHQLTFTSGEYSDGAPVWSPDGRKIAFASNRETGLGNIYIMNADGSGVQKLTSFPHGADYPTWSPDGTKIAFTARTKVEGEWGFDIFVVGADGGSVVNVTKTFGDEGAPSWSPDGGKIAFASWEGICVMNVDGSVREVIVPGLDHSSPDWSPDGKRIAFHSFSLAGPGDWEIYLVNPDGSNRTRLTILSNYGVSHPAWSPDGKKVAFNAGESIYVIDIESHRVTELVRGDEPDWHE
jgi:Tol biopolymer transport system component